MEINERKDQFSFIIDAYTIMEHIYQNISCVDSLSSLGKLYKLNEKAISEAVFMTSFEIFPSFLSNTGARPLKILSGHEPTYRPRISHILFLLANGIFPWRNTIRDVKKN